MASEIVTLDSSNLSAIIQDATGEPLEKPKEEAKPESKPEPKADAKAAPAAAKEATEDEDGLTPEERKDLTRKMQVAVGRRHRQMREAQEQAARDAAERRRAEERAEAAERELAKFREQPKVEAEKPKEPQPADFESTEAYMAARVKWEVSQELAREREERRKADEQAEQERILNAARERIARAIELVPDFEDITGSVDLNVPPHIAGYMQESEMFAELGYHFAQHPEELEALAAMKPAASLVALGKIESKLSPFAPAKEDGAKPSTETDASPSRPRVSAPVIRPLSPRGAPQPEVTETETNSRSSVRSFAKRTGVDLTRRQRH